MQTNTHRGKHATSYEVLTTSKHHNFFFSPTLGQRPMSAFMSNALYIYVMFGSESGHVCEFQPRNERVEKVRQLRKHHSSGTHPNLNYAVLPL
jgi:hypothetical protein